MKYLTPTLETERLILKRGRKEDYISVYEYDFTKLRDVDEEFKFVKLDSSVGESFYSSKKYLNDMFDWIIYLKNTGKPIGNILAMRLSNEENATEISYNLHPNYWHKGYMTEATTSVINYLFEKGFDNIFCGYEEGNFKSKGLIEKLGFELYETKENAWMKNNKPITNYIYVMNNHKKKKSH